MNVLPWEDFKPNPRLVTKCRLRGSVSAAHLHPKPGLAEELELLGPGGTSVKNGDTLQGGRNLLLAQGSRGMEGEASFGA